MQHPLHILIVDDSPLDAELLVHAMRREGYTPDWMLAENAAEMRSALKTRPDLVFSDCNMGQFDAGDALRLLQSEAPGVPLVVCTGSADDATIAALRKQGAAGVLFKDKLVELGPMIAHALGQGPARP